MATEHLPQRRAGRISGGGGADLGARQCGRGLHGLLGEIFADASATPLPPLRRVRVRLVREIARAFFFAVGLARTRCAERREHSRGRGRTARQGHLPRVRASMLAMRKGDRRAARASSARARLASPRPAWRRCEGGTVISSSDTPAVSCTAPSCGRETAQRRPRRQGDRRIRLDSTPTA